MYQTNCFTTNVPNFYDKFQFHPQNALQYIFLFDPYILALRCAANIIYKTICMNVKEIIVISLALLP